MEAGSGVSEFAAERNTVKYYYSKRSDPIFMAQGRPVLGRQPLPNSNFGHAPPCNGEFELGAFYEIDHGKLPPKSPIQLKAIRVVKVSETTSLDVTVSFPSILSLRNYLCLLTEDENGPELDERFVMSTNQAGRILWRLVPGSQFEGGKHLESFWLVAPKPLEFHPSPPTLPITPTAEEGEVKSPTPTDSCLLALKGASGWGIRRKVRYIGRLREIPLSETKEDVEVDVEKEEEEDKTQLHIGRKRTRETFKKEKKERRKKKTKAEDNKEKKKLRHEERRKGDKENREKGSKDRWSSERYEAAEIKLLEIMKQKKAVLGSPILRQALREEARKHIGDTGLLDHLLKHMAGKTVKDGAERFRRRHNADGAMEYWLEPADLEETRQKAGVVDPYWIPPPGWKLGDTTSPSPCSGECKKEIDLLREDIAVLKRDMEKLYYLKHLEEAVKGAKSEFDAICSTWQEQYESLLKRSTKLEEEMSGISTSLQVLKEEVRPLKDQVKNKEAMAVEVVMEDRGSPGAGDGNEKRGKHGNNNTDTNNTGSNTSTNSTATTVANTENDKATNNNGSGGCNGSKRTVRRSGFRICKPQGTFLWPNMGSITYAGIKPSISISRAVASGIVGEFLSSSHLPGPMGPTTTIATSTNSTNTALEEHQMLLAGAPTPPSASSATSAPKLPLLPTGPASPSLPRPAADVVMVVPPSPQQQQRQERTPSSGYDCPSSVYHQHSARGTLSPLAVDEGEARGWSNAITTDLALATPSSSYRLANGL